MKKTMASITVQADAIRAGVISSLIFAICFLCATGISSLPCAWTLMVLIAVCFVLMLKSVVDLLVWAFGVAAAFSGRSLGKSVRLIRCL